MRPAVDVVVPLRGDAADLRRLRERLAELQTGPEDTLTVVDNAGTAPGADLVAAEVRSSYHARNAGAVRGSAEWIVFLDADVVPSPALLDAYFAPEPGSRTGLLAGGVVDEPAQDGSPAAVRYAALKAAMSHETVLGRGRWSFAQTANCAVRRAAFEAVSGFCAEVRSGGDADLAFRLRDAGWGLEERPAASVLHRNRQTLLALLRQRARHGSGAAWLDTRHPGSMPARGRPGLVLWGLRRWGEALRARAAGDRDAALVAAVDPVAVWAYELGRLLPNHARRP